MARALICDLCGGTFPETTPETGTGKWHKARKRVAGKRIEIVYGVFTAPQLTLANITGQAPVPKGKPIDVCADCITKILTEESYDDRVPERPDEGANAPDGTG